MMLLIASFRVIYQCAGSHTAVRGRFRCVWLISTWFATFLVRFDSGLTYSDGILCLRCSGLVLNLQTPGWLLWAFGWFGELTLLFFDVSEKAMFISYIVCCWHDAVVVRRSLFVSPVIILLYSMLLRLWVSGFIGAIVMLLVIFCSMCAISQHWDLNMGSLL